MKLNTNPHPCTDRVRSGSRASSRLWLFVTSLLMLIACGTSSDSVRTVAEERLAIDFATGNVQGTVTWNGAAVSGLSGSGIVALVQDPVSGAYIGGSSVQDGSYLHTNVPPGSYSLQLAEGGCGGPESLLGEASVEVVGGDTVTADLDITATAGQVLGSITVNGSVLPYPTVFVDGHCGTWASDEYGSFGRFLPAGNYTARVYATGQIGSFPFAVLAGETTDVDSGTTPAGSFVTVELSGGADEVGGLDLTFGTVTTSGQTTVVESGFGPPPPTGYQILGIGNQGGEPRYWDIDTTAEYSGLITVCLHYDQGEVQGSEGALRLFHDPGTGFVDITTSLDVTADVICGVTSSLSPFAVAEPISTDNLRADGVVGVWVNRNRGNLRLIGTFTNTGTDPLPTATASLFVDLNSNATQDTGEPSRSFTFRNLRAGATRILTAPFNGLPRGSYKGVLQADPAGTLAESNENDNVAIVSVSR